MPIRNLLCRVSFLLVFILTLPEVAHSEESISSATTITIDSPASGAEQSEHKIDEAKPQKSESTNTPQRASTIQSVRIRRWPIYLDAKFPYTVVNALHFKTRRKVISRELLFKKGEPFNRQLMEESERILRSFPYFRKVTISAVHNAQGDVDITVDTIDAWTTVIVFSLSRTGGEMQGLLGMREQNLVGLGKELSAYYFRDITQQGYHFRYTDPRVLGKNLSSSMNITSGTDYEQKRLSIEKPFTSTLTEFAGGVSFFEWQGIRSLYELGEAYQNFTQTHQRAQAYIGYTPRPNPSRTTRFVVGYEYRNDIFDVDPDYPLLLNSDFHRERYSGPYISFFHGRTRYLKVQNIKTYDRDEDYNLGFEASTTAWWAPEWTGSRGNFWVGSASLRKGWQFSASSFTITHLALSGRYAHARWSNSNVFSLTNLFYQPHRRLTLANRLLLTYWFKPDPDVQVLFGGSNGLNGYKLNYFSGTKGAIYNFETRILLLDDFLKLITIGGTIFFDAGNAYDSQDPVTFNSLNADAGVGLRLTFPRSSSGSVLRIFYSYAFHDNGLDNRWLFSFTADDLFR